MNAPQWSTLSDKLASALKGYQVRQAIFTTYAFEPEFFESSIFPLLVGSRGEGLSMNAALRRLQLEQLLRTSPIPTDVFFDANVVVPGAPWLPYSLHPVRMEGEFHGKVVLLRLESEHGAIRWLLGAGSANLTKAGWWNNIEVWHFAPIFDPRRPPGNLAPGIRALLRFLARQRAAIGVDRQDRTSALQALQRDFNGAAPIKSTQKGMRFEIFYPGHQSFPSWLARQPERAKDAHLEIISPYFSENQHRERIDEIRDAVGAEQVRVWLPEDPWQAGGPTVLMQEAQYDEIYQYSKYAKWSRFSEKTLMSARQPSAVPRFLHAKVFRVPGAFSFIGSVNFSYKAFHRNFEAGFLVKDDDGPWLTPTAVKPVRFEKPKEDATLPPSDGIFKAYAHFDWQSRQLTLHFSNDTIAQYTGRRFAILDARGVKAVGGNVPQAGAAVFGFKDDDEICIGLQRCTWITVSISEESFPVWVQQESLEYRPPPVDLTPNAWRILDFWRNLNDGASGSGSRAYENLEIQLAKNGDRGEDPVAAELKEDLFNSMAIMHGSFYSLREVLDHCRAKKDSARLQYYFGASRQDTLKSLLDRLISESSDKDESSIDPVQSWVMLRWIQQLCTENTDVPESRGLKTRTKEAIAKLEHSSPLNGIDKEWLKWTATMFLCLPGHEQATANRLKQKKAKQ